MHQRHLFSKIIEALTDTPVIFINGARQTGKSTLVKQLAKEQYPALYCNLDNASTLASLKSDPIGFIEDLKGPVIIDEIQRSPDLLLAIKESVDKDRKPGRFILTGSANILLLPQISDSLAGRMEIFTLWPLSQGEIHNTQDNFIDRLFTSPFDIRENPVSRDQLINLILQGGYPEVLSRKSHSRRHAWYDSYLTALLQKDIRDISNIEGLTQFPRLLALLASRIGCLLNIADISRGAGIAQTTLTRYMTLLQTIFLTHTIPAWSNNQSSRIIKSPKFYLSDSGLAADATGITLKRIQHEPHLLGPLLENFVVMELTKQLGWNTTIANLFHYRTTTGQEVDLVLEDSSGQCICIEIKASHTLSEKDFRSIKYFAEEIGERFKRGIVLYTGEKILSFGKNLYAIPVSSIW